jgi:hypothetical protein
MIADICETLLNSSRAKFVTFVDAAGRALCAVGHAAASDLVWLNSYLGDLARLSSGHLGTKIGERAFPAPSAKYQLSEYTQVSFAAVGDRALAVLFDLDTTHGLVRIRMEAAVRELSVLSNDGS